MDYYRVIAISVGGKRGKVHYKKDNEILPASAFIEENIPTLLKYKSIEKVEDGTPKQETKPEPTKVTHEVNLDEMLLPELKDYAESKSYPKKEWQKKNKAGLLKYLKDKA